jgi:predicted nucleic acid-binding protein
MDVLADTNILVRGVHRKEAGHREALQALRALRDRGDRICIVPQNLYEFWVVATRPIQSNGLALTPAQAGRMTYRVEEVCSLLRDTPAIYDEWRRLVALYAVSGKNSHDARLVAAMKIHSITHILTFNSPDFARYPEITVIEPSTFSVSR